MKFGRPYPARRHMSAGAFKQAALAGGFSFVNAEAALLVAAMSVQPDDTRKTLIDACITLLKANGAWSTLDFFYMLLAHDSQAALLNWIDPSNSLSVFAGSPAFTANAGYSGTDGTDILVDYRNVNTLSKFVASDCSFGLWNVSSPPYSYDFCGVTGPDNIGFAPRRNGYFGYPTARLLNTGEVLHNVDYGGNGVMGVTVAPSDNTKSQVYINGSIVGALYGYPATGARPAKPFKIGDGYTTSAVTWTFRCFYAGGKLSAQQVSDIYTALTTFYAGL